MVGLEETMRQVRETMRDHDMAQEAHHRTQRMHERILNDYADKIRRHDSRSDRSDEERQRRRDYDSDRHRDRDRDRDRERRHDSLRFRFKSDSKSSDDKRRKQKQKQKRKHHHHSSSKHKRPSPQPEEGDSNLQQYAAHPFARPRNSDYLDPSISQSPQPEPVPDEFAGPDDAFRQSLFDAIADDEGAAYWEGVYSQPIHVYPRPQVQNEQGHLEQMTDDQYVDYVKSKMWEKRNPELVEERRRRAEEGTSDKRKREPDEDEEEGDFEWVGDEERGYERRYTGARRSKPKIPKDTAFMADVDAALARGAKRKEGKKRQQLWSSYQSKWQDLKNSTAPLQGSELQLAIPWPVDTLNSKDVTKENIEEFFRHAVLGTGETKMGMLKAERFRWHPDKIQHRFGGGNVDEEAMKLVTAVFQTIDEMLVAERQRVGKD